MISFIWAREVRMQGGISIAKNRRMIGHSEALEILQLKGLNRTLYHQLVWSKMISRLRSQITNSLACSFAQIWLNSHVNLTLLRSTRWTTQLAVIEWPHGWVTSKQLLKSGNPQWNYIFVEVCSSSRIDLLPCSSRERFWTIPQCSESLRLLIVSNY